MGTISGCRHLKVNLKAKIYIYVNSSTQRCPNKISKIFLIEDRWCTLNLKYLREFSKKFETSLMVYSAWGKLIHEKNQKSKISWDCSFKGTVQQFAVALRLLSYRFKYQKTENGGKYIYYNLKINNRSWLYSTGRRSKHWFRPFSLPFLLGASPHHHLWWII